MRDIPLLISKELLKVILEEAYNEVPQWAIIEGLSPATGNRGSPPDIYNIEPVSASHGRYEGCGSRGFPAGMAK